MTINSQIVTLINGIISHGNHNHNELPAIEFENMRDAYNAVEAWPENGIVYKSSIDGSFAVEPADTYDWLLLDFACKNENEVAELIELYETLENEIEGDDFTVEFDGNEYRIISDSSIWEIYVETIKDIVNNCYDLKLDKIPDFIAFDIDWEQTAQNAYVDGYGHTFASYDGEESEAAGFWIFRTN